MGIWACASLCLRDCPFIEPHSIAALPRITHWDVQELSNTAWAVAKLGFRDEPLLHSISAAAMRRIAPYVARDLANSLGIRHTRCSEHAALYCDCIVSSADTCRRRPSGFIEHSVVFRRTARC